MKLFVDGISWRIFELLYNTKTGLGTPIFTVEPDELINRASELAEDEDVIAVFCVPPVHSTFFALVRSPEMAEIIHKKYKARWG